MDKEDENTYTTEYYSDIKKNEITPFVQHGWTQKLSYQLSQTERQRHKYDITYMWSLKQDTNQLIYKTERDSQMQKINLWLSNGKRVWEG